MLAHTQLHMVNAHVLVPDTHRITVLLIAINDMVLYMHTTDGWYGTYTYQPASSFGEFIVMPPDDSTLEIRPVGRMNTMYTTERRTIHTHGMSVDGSLKLCSRGCVVIGMYISVSYTHLTLPTKA